MTNKLGVVLASAAAVAFLAVTGCASQQSAAPATAADSNVATANACKGKSACKQMHKKHHKAAAKADTTSSTDSKTTTTTSTETTTK